MAEVPEVDARETPGVELYPVPVYGVALRDTVSLSPLHPSFL